MTLDFDLATELIRRSLILVLLLSAPVLVCGLAVGIVISLLQAVTQIQEQSLAFIPKILVMFIVAAVTLPWVGGHMLEFAREIFTLGPMP
jgi:flagellar biosynthetic protein FliQ